MGGMVAGPSPRLQNAAIDATPPATMTFTRILHRAARYRGRLIAISVLALLGSASLLSIPALAGLLLGDAVSGAGLQGTTIVLLLLGALLLTTVFTLASNIVTADASARILADLRCEVFDHITHMPLAFHDDSRQGDLLALATYEPGRLSAFLTSTLANVPAMLATSAGATVALFLIDPLLAILVPVLVPVFYIVLKLLGRRLRKLANRAREAEGEVYAVAESHLQMLLATKTFAVEPEQAALYAQTVEKSRELGLARDHAGAAIGPVAGFIAGCAAIGVIVAAGSQISDVQDNPAELFSFLLYAALLTRPIGALSGVYGQWQVARGTLVRLDRILALPEEPGYRGNRQLAAPRGAIAFEDVAFSYPGRNGPIRRASLAIEPGEIVALIGENGCGKTTLLKLMLRLYDVDAGRITFDGHDITTLDIRDLRRHVGYVPQRALLFNGSIRDNLTFGYRGDGAPNLQRALALAQAEHFVAGLPDGLDTLIGDNGMRLSGGQRQRIALARAILADPPVLVFDEATSMWDLDGEAAFVESFRDALEGRTVILITHRPASLALADRVVLVENGECRELRPGPERDAALAGRAVAGGR